MSEAENVARQTATANKAVDLDQQPHERRDIEILYKIYMEKRLASQAAFYESRIRENQSNADFTFTVGAAVMTISSLVATISAADHSPFFSLLSAILPAFAALLASFRQLYGWERQISIYRDALMGLERVKLVTPDKDRMPLSDLQAIYPKLVTNGEAVFTGEVNQWGQFVQTTDKGAVEPDVDTQATNALMGDLRLTDDQINTIRRIVAAGTPKPAFSQETITVHPEDASSLPAGVSSTPAEAQAAPAAPASGVAPVSVTATRQTTTTIQPQESTTALPPEDHPAASESVPIAVTTTHVDTTVVEHVIPPANAPIETPVVSSGEHEAPPQEGSDSLAPGAMHVDTPQQEDIDAIANHHEFANEPPPPEAASSLAPGAMHVDAPQAPPENPEAQPNPSDNG